MVVHVHRPDRHAPRSCGYTIETEGVQLTPNGAVLQTGFSAAWSRNSSRTNRDPLAAPSKVFPPPAGHPHPGCWPDQLRGGAGRGSTGCRKRRPRIPRPVRRTGGDIRPDEVRGAAHGEFRPRSSVPPLLALRLEEYVGTVKLPAFGVFLKSAVEEVRDAGKFRDYLRSLLLHGLLLELHGLFVIHGRGDERQVLGHARLPLRFPPTRTTLSVFGGNDHSDGTTHTLPRPTSTRLWGNSSTRRTGRLPMQPRTHSIDLLFDSEEARRVATRDPRDPATSPDRPRVDRHRCGRSDPPAGALACPLSEEAAGAWSTSRRTTCTARSAACGGRWRCPSAAGRARGSW